MFQKVYYTHYDHNNNLFCFALRDSDFIVNFTTSKDNRYFIVIQLLAIYMTKKLSYRDVVKNIALYYKQTLKFISLNVIINYILTDVEEILHHKSGAPEAEIRKLFQCIINQIAKYKYCQKK